MRHIADDNRKLRLLAAEDNLVISPNPNLGASFPLPFLQPTKLMPCSLEHDDCSLVRSSGTSDAMNVTLFASSSPAQMRGKTSDQSGNDLEVLRFVPCA